MDIDGNIRFPPGKRPKKRGPNQQALTLTHIGCSKERQSFVQYSIIKIKKLAYQCRKAWYLSPVKK
jgi:hypothetical protein